MSQPPAMHFDLLGAHNAQSQLRHYNRLIAQLSGRPAVDLERLLALIEDGNYIWLADGPGIQGAVATATCTFTLKRQGLWGQVEDVIVDNHWRRQGFGEALMRHVIHFASEEIGAEGLQLTSRSTRVEAHELYKSLGFEMVPTTVFRLELPWQSS